MRRRKKGRTRRWTDDSHRAPRLEHFHPSTGRRMTRTAPSSGASATPGPRHPASTDQDCSRHLHAPNSHPPETDPLLIGSVAGKPLPCNVSVCALRRAVLTNSHTPTAVSLFYPLGTGGTAQGLRVLRLHARQVRAVRRLHRRPPHPFPRPPACGARPRPVIARPPLARRPARTGQAAVRADSAGSASRHRLRPPFGACSPVIVTRFRAILTLRAGVGEARAAGADGASRVPVPARALPPPLTPPALRFSGAAAAG